MFHDEDRFGERRYRYGRGGFFFFPWLPLIGFFLLFTLLFSGWHHFWFFGLPLMFLFPMFLVGMGIMFLFRGLGGNDHRWERHEWQKRKRAQFRAMYGMEDAEPERSDADPDYSDHDDMDSDIHYV